MNQKGAISLLTVLIVGAICGAITSALIIGGIDSTQTSGEYSDSSKSKTIADGCAESALLRVRQDNTFTGTDSASIDSQNCDYEVIDGGGENRTIQAVATVNNNVRRIEISIDQITPQINIINWAEVSSF